MFPVLSYCFTSPLTLSSSSMLCGSSICSFFKSSPRMRNPSYTLPVKKGVLVLIAFPILTLSVMSRRRTYAPILSYQGCSFPRPLKMTPSSTSWFISSSAQYEGTANGSPCGSKLRYCGYVNNQESFLYLPRERLIEYPRVCRKSLFNCLCIFACKSLCKEVFGDT